MLMTIMFFICTIYMHGNCTQAADLGGISPDMSFEIAVVLKGQSAVSISSTAATPFDLTNVGILPIGNQSLIASLDINL
jgi:hypothetical protein